MNGIHIVICVEYLLSLLDFVNEGLAVLPAKKETDSGKEHVYFSRCQFIPFYVSLYGVCCMLG